MKLFAAIALTVGLISTTASAGTGVTDPNANVPSDSAYQAPSVNTSNDVKGTSDISGTDGTRDQSSGLPLPVAPAK
ncbi:hypothetical protein [Mesorhizobium caraganae]|uniref:hypothetical protein n=1 Tax=Mesorhizobium caraganae TaxID=483206 RepID=UPI0017814726|nr:hypothetical protein [Mesorhizobium caraganae]